MIYYRSSSSWRGHTNEKLQQLTGASLSSNLQSRNSMLKWMISNGRWTGKHTLWTKNYIANCDSFNSCTKKASASLLQKRKPLALSYLRSKKQLEDLLTKRLGSLGILESTLIQVEGAAGDVEVRCALVLSTQCLLICNALRSL